jgi:hypothetical protein
VIQYPLTLPWPEPRGSQFGVGWPREACQTSMMMGMITGRRAVSARITLPAA